MQTSERGSAVAEFLLLVLPIVLCISSTVQVAWVSFAKSQLRVIAATSAFEASQPDSDPNNVLEGTRARALQRLNISPTVLLETQNGITRVEMELLGWPFSANPLFRVPSIEVSGYGVLENQ